MQNLTDRLLIATSSAGMGVWEWDIKKNELEIDDGMRRLYKIGNDTSLSAYETWLSRLHPEDKSRVNEEIQLAITGIKEYNTEFRIIWEDASIHYIKATGGTQKGEDGYAIRMIGLNWEITERKLSEARLQELNEQLIMHVKALAISNSELEQFAYVASHDLQEPLRMVVSYLALIEKKYGHLVDEKGKRYFNFAVDGAKRMRQIILDLLEFSKVGRGGNALENIDLNDMIAGIKILLKKEIEEKNATIVAEDLPGICGYRSPMHQVFQNLISNALKYSRKNVPSRIHIIAKEFDKHWQFTVSDNGIGICKDYFEKIFVLFQRLHGKEEFSGAGMGLAIAKKIIETQGGEIWVDSKEGEGSNFNFTIKK